jgi:hypothetical protein
MGLLKKLVGKTPSYEVILVRRWGGYSRDAFSKLQVASIKKAFRAEGMKGKIKVIKFRK